MALARVCAIRSSIWDIPALVACLSKLLELAQGVGGFAIVLERSVLTIPAKLMPTTKQEAKTTPVIDNRPLGNQRNM